MKIQAVSAAFVLVMLGPASAGAGAAGKEGKPGYLSPPDLFELMEKSPRSYRISPLSELKDVSRDAFADVFWPAGQGLDHPFIESKDESERSLVPYPFGKACLDILTEAEPHFQKKDYDKAASLYQKAAGEDPRCYLALMGLGDTHELSGRHREALELYEKASKVNPFDFHVWWYQGTALASMEKKDQARGMYARALALRPRHANLMTAIASRQESLGVKLREAPFTPRALARREADDIALYMDPEWPHWLVYATCKAIWIGEEAHRLERTGGADHDWTMTEEIQCLLSMLEGHEAAREKGKAADPEMERLLAIAKDGMLDEFVLYEMASRIAPDQIPMMGDEVIESMKGFVEKHILISR